ncbi:MAG TPA: hypothetical protein VG096_20445 [Bryobacteraceae bacterium]|jgi:hypothetical protein|nr:hypothetical protein [Bryobacteraceae bacterium]
MLNSEGERPNERFQADIDGLGTAGKELLAWLREIAEVDGALPLVVQTCQIADRLAEIRQKIKTSGLILSRDRRNPLLAEEARFMKQYALNWRNLGLADRDPEEKRRVGRPSGDLWRPRD